MPNRRRGAFHARSLTRWERSGSNLVHETSLRAQMVGRQGRRQPLRPLGSPPRNTKRLSACARCSDVRSPRARLGSVPGRATISVSKTVNLQSQVLYIRCLTESLRRFVWSSATSLGSYLLRKGHRIYGAATKSGSLAVIQHVQTPWSTGSAWSISLHTHPLLASVALTNGFMLMSLTAR